MDFDKEMEKKFDELLEKLKQTNDIAALNGIPSESNALLQNCLNDIQNEENAYQRTLRQLTPPGTKPEMQPEKKPVKMIQTVPITMRTLTKGKSYTIRDVEDVNVFLEEIKRELIEKLGDDKVIKLS